MESPECDAALQAADAVVDAAADLNAAFAQAAARGAVLRPDEYRPLLARLDVAEAKWMAANARLAKGH